MANIGRTDPWRDMVCAPHSKASELTRDHSWYAPAGLEKTSQ
jgi:hypothetical protein